MSDVLPNDSIPDAWLLVKVEQEKGHPIFKVFATWKEEESWRLNAGIISVKYKNGNYIFYSNSGSRYICNEKSYGETEFGSMIINGIEKLLADTVEVYRKMPTHDFIMSIPDNSD